MSWHVQRFFMVKCVVRRGAGAPPTIRILSKFARFAGFRSCSCTHQNMPFSDEKWIFLAKILKFFYLRPPENEATLLSANVWAKSWLCLCTAIDCFHGHCCITIHAYDIHGYRRQALSNDWKLRKIKKNQEKEIKKHNKKLVIKISKTVKENKRLCYRRDNVGRRSLCRGHSRWICYHRKPKCNFLLILCHRFKVIADYL